MKNHLTYPRLRSTVLCIGLAFGAMAPGMGLAASSSSVAVAAPELSANDTSFANEISRTARHQIQMARLAEQRAKDANVKAFASMVVRHRLSADIQLRDWAKARGLDLAQLESQSNVEREDALANLRGYEFDKHFVRAIGIEELRSVIERLDAASNSITDDELRAWATRNLPELKQQLAVAERLTAVQR